MKIFNKIIMASEDIGSMLKTCYFQSTVSGSQVDTAVEDGAVVAIGDPRVHDLYSSMKDLNARNCTAFATGSKIVGVVDYVGVEQTAVGDRTFRVGGKIAGIAPQAGEPIRVRMLAVGDEFYLGNENFDASPAVGKYAYPEDGKTTWKVDASAAASGLCIKLEDTRALIMGQKNEGSTLYRCRVISC